MTDAPRFLVIDGYTKEARDGLTAGGASTAGRLYSRMLTSNAPPGSQCDILYPSDPGATLPAGSDLSSYDGIAWTGCSLTVFHDIPEVRGQVDLCRTAYTVGVPGFGSCWAAQIAVVAAGGEVKVNPKGREMGIARKITLTPEGRSHPLYDGKASVFDAFISHEDEITRLPDGGVNLSGNHFTSVQSVAVTHERGVFWGLQYHPEYDLHEMARLAFCRIERLVTLGFFADREAALTYVDQMETLHADRSRHDIAWLLGIDDDVMDVDIRCIEVRNWIDKLVLPTMAGRS